jgi:hypothetical protein
MKKYIILSALLALFTLSLSAQNAYRTAGDKTIGISAGYGQTGIGVAASFDYTLLGWGAGGSLSVGGYLGDSFKNKINYALVGPMVCYRIPLGENFDLSAKVIAGMGIMSSGAATLTFFMKGAYIGGTYYISDKMGIGAELGAGGATNIAAHISIRL